MLNSYSHTVNTTREFTVTSSYPYGEYEIKAVVSEQTTTTFLTVLDITDWQPATFPYQKTFKNINYTFFANGTLRAEQNGEILDIDLSTLRYLINLYDLDVTATYNNMNFRINVQKYGIANINFVFSFVHTGCKFIVSGELNQARDFSFNVKNPSKLKQLLDSVKQGSIIFDYSDLRKVSYVFSYSNGILTLSLPKTFSFDPTIFSDGFESGDLSEWTGVYTSPSVVDTRPHHGTYCAVAQGAAVAQVYKTIAAQTEIYQRYYIQMDQLPDSGGGFGVIRFRGAGDVFRVQYRNDAGVLRWRFIATGYDVYVNQSLSADTWYCIEAEYKQDAVTGEYKFWVDGDLIWSATGIDTSGVETVTHIRAGKIEEWGTTYDLYFDCVVVDSSYIGVEVSGQNITEILSETLTISSSTIDLKEKLVSYGETTTLQTEMTTQKEQSITMIEIMQEVIQVTAQLFIYTDEIIGALSPVLLFGLLGFIFGICALAMVIAKKK